MASLRPRKNKDGQITTFYLRYRDDSGKEMAVNLHTNNKTEANKLKRKFETKQTAEKLGIIEKNGYDSVRLDDAMDDFMEYKKADNDEPAQIDRYKRVLTDFRAAVGTNLYLNEISNRHLTPYIKLLNKRKIQPGGRNTNLAFLRVFSRWCFKNYRLQYPILYIDNDVMAKVPKLNRYISEAEFAEICKQISDPVLLAFARISKFIGFRLAEIIKATLVEQDGIEYLRVYGKKDKLHVAPLFDWLKPDWEEVDDYRILRGWGDPKRDSYKVVRNIKQTISKEFSKASKAAGVLTPCYNCDFSVWEVYKQGGKCPKCGKAFHRFGNGKQFHGLRYHFNTNTSLKTDVNTAQDIIGHSSRRMTEHYIKADELALVKKKRDQLEEIYKK